MNRGMIVKRDLSGDPANGEVAKLFLKLDGDGFGCYSLEFPEDDVALTMNLRNSCLQPRWCNEVDVFIGEALRHNAEFVPLLVPSHELITFMRQNRQRLGRLSRPLVS